MLELTDLGIVYLCSASVVILFFRPWLPALLILSTVIQAASVVNVSVAGIKYGLTTYNLTALFAGFMWVLQLRQAPFGIHTSLRLPIILLSLYAFVALVGSWWLPHHFSGTQVLQLNQIGLIVNPPQALHWGLINIVQAANLVINILMLLYLLQSAALDSLARRRAMLGLVAGFILVLAVGFYERGSLLFGWPSQFEFWSSNPFYHQKGISVGGLGTRIGIPFSEPSFSSAFLSAILAASFVLVLWGKRVWAGLLVFVLGTVAMLNSMGSTGVVASVIFLPLMFLWFSYQAWRLRSIRPELLQRWWLAVLFLFLLGLLVAVTDVLQPYVEQMKGLVHQQIEKLRFELFHEESIRFVVDYRGLEILRETSGLGLGLGSVRTSSFAITMLAATGIVGTLLWFGSLGGLVWRYFRAYRLSDGQLVAIAGLGGSTLAMIAAVPDLNMPMYWAFVFIAFVYCPEQGLPAVGSRRNRLQFEISKVGAGGTTVSGMTHAPTDPNHHVRPQYD